MRSDVETILNEFMDRFPNLENMRSQLADAAETLICCLETGGKILLCGNGGSAADCEHIAGELLKGFKKRRPLPPELHHAILERISSHATGQSGLAAIAELPSLLDRLQNGLPAVSLVSQAAISTAIANDQGADLVFAQQLMGLGEPGDLLLGISTSGNADNIIKAMLLARGLGLKTMALTGESGGQLLDVADICLRMPARDTDKVQEMHLPVYHLLCSMTEQHFFP